jgi:hypothetical protein
VTAPLLMMWYTRLYSFSCMSMLIHSTPTLPPSNTFHEHLLCCQLHSYAPELGLVPSYCLYTT